MNIQTIDESEYINSEEVMAFLATSHDALVGLIPINPEISRTDEECEIVKITSESS